MILQVWQVVHKKMECIEVIETKEPIRHLNTCGDMIFAITRGQGIKVIRMVASPIGNDSYKLYVFEDQDSKTSAVL